MGMWCISSERMRMALAVLNVLSAEQAIAISVCSWVMALVVHTAHSSHRKQLK